MSAPSLETKALVVRSVDSREADRIVTLLTERAGLVAVVARGVRNASKRLGGVVEPMHRLAVTITHPEREVATLAEARVDAVRLGIGAHLEATLVAGYWLRFARALAHPHGDDGSLFASTDGALALLEADARRAPEVEHLVPFAMLAASGYALELDACVACGKVCPESRPSGIDGLRGGLVCRGCGAAPRVLSPALRETLRGAQRGSLDALRPDDREAAAGLAQDVLRHHLGRTVR